MAHGRIDSAASIIIVRVVRRVVASQAHQHHARVLGSTPSPGHAIEAAPVAHRCEPIQYNVALEIAVQHQRRPARHDHAKRMAGRVELCGCHDERADPVVVKHRGKSDLSRALAGTDPHKCSQAAFQTLHHPWTPPAL